MASREAHDCDGGLWKNGAVTMPTTDARPAGTRIPAMVVTDLDGTLLGADSRVSARNAAALARAADAGARVVIATGRPACWLGPVIDAGFTGTAVCMNGAVVYDIAAGEVLSSIVLQPTAMQSFVDELDVLSLEYALAVERLGVTADDFWAEPTYVHPWDDGEYQRIDRTELLAGPAAKLLVRYGHESGALLDAARAVSREQVAVTYSSGDGLIEVAAAGVTKGAALAVLANGWGIDATDVVAFGDMPNDLEMLQWAGMSVAMANAVPEVAAAAREVGPRHDEDGVALVLERWF
jgi:Cof subfamily protein (haloacid dehalogenase superfamily)